MLGQCAGAPVGGVDRPVVQRGMHDARLRFGSDRRGASRARCVFAKCIDAAIQEALAPAWTNCRKSLADAGLALHVLENFGMENKVVSAGHTEQDFRAKFLCGYFRQLERGLQRLDQFCPRSIDGEHVVPTHESSILRPPLPATNGAKAVFTGALVQSLGKIFEYLPKQA